MVPVLFCSYCEIPTYILKKTNCYICLAVVYSEEPHGVL